MVRRAATDDWAAQSILDILLARSLPDYCRKGVPEVTMNKLDNWLITTTGSGKNSIHFSSFM